MNLMALDSKFAASVVMQHAKGEIFLLCQWLLKVFDIFRFANTFSNVLRWNADLCKRRHVKK